SPDSRAASDPLKESYRPRRDIIGTHLVRKYTCYGVVRFFGSVGLTGVSSGSDDGGLDVLNSDVEGLGQGLECLRTGKSFGATGLPPDVRGHRYVCSSSEGAGAESCGGAQASQVSRALGFEEVFCTDVQGLGEAVEYLRPWSGTAQLPT